MSLPDYKPVSVPVQARWQPFILAGDLSPAPATYPEVVTERAAPPPLFGLAPHGVCPASERYRRRGALLPHLFTLTRTDREARPGGTFSVALSVKSAYERTPPAVSRHAALWRPDFPPAFAGLPAHASGCQSGRLLSMIAQIETFCAPWIPFCRSPLNARP